MGSVENWIKRDKMQLYYAGERSPTLVNVRRVNDRPCV
jgi:hypothetical protein